MPSASADPFDVQSIEVADVERVENAALRRRESQLLRIRPSHETRVQRRHHGHAARPKSRDQIAVHRIFIEVDLKLAHGCGSTPVLLFQCFRLSRLGFQVRVDLRLIGVIIGEGRMHLRQR